MVLEVHSFQHMISRTMFRSIKCIHQLFCTFNTFIHSVCAIDFFDFWFFSTGLQWFQKINMTCSTFIFLSLSSFLHGKDVVERKRFFDNPQSNGLVFQFAKLRSINWTEHYHTVFHHPTGMTSLPFYQWICRRFVIGDTLYFLYENPDKFIIRSDTN